MISRTILRQLDLTSRALLAFFDIDRPNTVLDMSDHFIAASLLPELTSTLTEQECDLTSRPNVPNLSHAAHTKRISSSTESGVACARFV